MPNRLINDDVFHKLKAEFEAGFKEVAKVSTTDNYLNNILTVLETFETAGKITAADKWRIGAKALNEFITMDVNIQVDIYEGFKTYETWNVAKWTRENYTVRKLAEKSANYQEFATKVKQLHCVTPDWVRWDSDRIDTAVMDRIINELRERFENE